MINGKRWRRRGGASLVLIALAGATLPAPSARAASPGCSLGYHCYSVLIATGTTFYGMYGTWGRAAMATPSNSGNKYFLDSEMWFPGGSGSSAWAETGLAAGWFGVPSASGYYGFAAYRTTGGTYKEHSFGLKAQNSGTTDEYQISRASSTNKWHIYMDGALWATPSLGFWSGSHPQAGGEVATPSGTSGTFTMYLTAYNSSSAKVNFGSVTTAIDNPPLSGSSPANSTWKWKIG